MLTAERTQRVLLATRGTTVYSTFFNPFREIMFSPIMLLVLTSIIQIPAGYFQLVTSLLSSANLFKTPFMVSLKRRPTT
jgi:hypothetical protein